MDKTVIQNIQAPVYGHVAAGNITIVEHHQQERELTWWDLPTDALRQRLRAARSERWRAWRRYWFNTPLFLLSLYMIGLIAWVWRQIPVGPAFQHSALTPTLSPWLFLILIGGVALPLMYWLQTIRRIESKVAAQAQAEIDVIEVVLRCRR